jgi:hypothetical protein
LCFQKINKFREQWLFPLLARRFVRTLPGVNPFEKVRQFRYRALLKLRLHDAMDSCCSAAVFLLCSHAGYSGQLCRNRLFISMISIMGEDLFPEMRAFQAIGEKNG